MVMVLKFCLASFNPINGPESYKLFIGSPTFEIPKLGSFFTIIYLGCNTNLNGYYILLQLTSVLILFVMFINIRIKNFISALC